METWTRDEILAARKARGNKPGKKERARMRKKQKQQEEQHISHNEYQKLVHEKEIAKKRALVAENRAFVAEQRVINILVHQHHYSPRIPLNEPSALQDTNEERTLTSQEKEQIYKNKRKRAGQAERGKQEYHRQQYFSHLQKAYYGPR